uniref:CRAL-TRIO domain-containing protein n=1 Tax=Panagrellus redivivus TaxID=6233 RepID=A0A7E4W0I1_PANRE
MAPLSSALSGSHYLNGTDITAELAEKIDDLKKALGEELLKEAWFYADDFSLLRWLYGWDFKIAEIVPRFKKSAYRLIALKIHEVSIDDVAECNEYLNKLVPWAQYYPGGIMSIDNEGNPILVQTVCKVHPKSLIQCDRVSQLFRLILTETFLVYMFMLKNEKRTNRKLGLRMIIDMEGFNKDLIHPTNMKNYLNLLSLIQDTFPDCARNIFIINAPMMMSAVYAIVKPALAKQTQEKIVFLGKDFRQKLCEKLGRENVLERWGGDLKASNGLETGHLRIGGVVPEDLYYNPSKNTYHVPSDKLTKVNVTAGRRKEVQVSVPQAGAKLHWFWTATNDIDFYVEDKTGNEIFPRMRLTTDYVPEFGHIEVTTEGEYTVVFDNSHGRVFSKDVKYHVYVEVNQD